MGSATKSSANVFLGVKWNACRIESLEPFDRGLKGPGSVLMATKCPLLLHERIGPQILKEIVGNLESQFRTEQFKRGFTEVHDLRISFCFGLSIRSNFWGCRGTGCLRVFRWQGVLILVKFMVAVI